VPFDEVSNRKSGSRLRPVVRLVDVSQPPDLVDVVRLSQGAVSIS
jgi:hypothetical protein